MAKSSGGTGRSPNKDVIREGVSAGGSVSGARQLRRLVATRGTDNIRRPSRRIRAR